MQCNKKILILLAGLFCAAALSGCAGKIAEQENGQEVSSPSQPTSEISKEVGSVSSQSEQSETGTSSEQTAFLPSSSAESSGTKETAYGEGIYWVEGINEETQQRDQLKFENGQLVYHYFSSPEIGKGSYGEGGSDELEYSPYYQKTVEEVLVLLKEQNLQVSVQQE